MKMNKTLILLSVGLLMLTAVSTAVEAADSNASVNFVPDNETELQPVLDPENLTPPLPEEELSEGVQNSTPGLLTLDFVSNINFAEQKVSATEQHYHSTTLRPFVQVTDIRGTGQGWSVTASMEGFKTINSEDVGVSSLKGATITFKGGEVDTNGSGEAPEVISQITEDNVSSFTLGTNSDAITVVNAEPGEGMGTWVTRWLDPDKSTPLNENVTLTVPGGTATTGNHTAIITWTLKNSPVSE